MALPDFLVIGAPKAGTTALHAALAGHPELFMSPVKEPKFFLTDGPPPRRGGGPGDVQTYREHIWRREDYEALFDAAPPGALRGELTPFYLYDRQAQRRIHALIPGARMIAVLRDPVERAHSNWTHLWSAGLDPIGDFPAACAAEDRRIAAGWAPFWHYTRLGRYGEQLDHLFTAVPPRAGPHPALPRPGGLAGAGAGRDLRLPGRAAGDHLAGAARERDGPPGALPQPPGRFPWCCGEPPPPGATCRARPAPPSPSRSNGSCSAARAPASR